MAPGGQKVWTDGWMEQMDRCRKDDKKIYPSDFVGG